MKIIISIKSVYGKECIYPACETSLLLSKLIGAKTFQPRHIELLKELGYILEVATPTL